ncbi:class I SAM-dependent methyltransferase [Candidatus Poriferisodalis sp.]|uniref:class I SAM-dependent methyltransferase n=1 Tax=Candidatus Poriferisodalis sp. TaxID=3101277 RepID=UPI003B022D86
MAGAAHTEEGAFNSLFAQALLQRSPGWQGHLNAEQSGVIRGAKSKRPDVVLHASSSTATVIEIEYDDSPPSSVEGDALARLGSQLATGALVEHVVALRVPAFLGALDQSAITGTLGDAQTRYSYCSFVSCLSGDASSSADPGAAHAGSPAERYPATGWIEGSLDDVVGFIETTAISEQAVERGATLLEEAVTESAYIVIFEAEKRPDALANIAQCLQQEPSLQTIRMAMTVLANACIVHRAIADAHAIKNFTQMRAKGLALGRPHVSQLEFVDEWHRIMHEVDYWPIFSLALDILSALPSPSASPVLLRMMGLAEDLEGLSTVTTGDLAGQAIGRLITDRKFLATFYTLPSSAAMLAELAVARLRIEPDGDHLAGELKIADLACGTGTLLSAAYRRVATRVRRHGVNDRSLHRHMVEDVLVGADIMPAATHLTVAQLSAAHPDITFTQTAIHTMPYGRHTVPGDDKPRTSIGSLDLLGTDVQLSVFGTGEQALSGSGLVSGHGPDGYGRLDLPAASLDLCIMNPPFTRPTTKETAEQQGVPVPAFAGFETTKAEQRAMSRELKRLGKRLPHRQVGHGNAGLATNFIDLAHLKTKPGGVLALVIPAAFTSGASWDGVRQILAREYRDVVVISIAAVGSTDRAFSADTGMAEVLVVATRRSAPKRLPPDGPTSANSEATVGGAGDPKPEDLALWVSLYERPAGIVAGVEIARALSTLRTDSAGSVVVGDEIVGTCTRASLDHGGCAAVREPDVARTALALTEGRLHLPRMADVSIPLVPLRELGVPGPYHLDIKSTGNTARGPFVIQDLTKNEPAAYPILWGHDATRERCLQVAPDTQGRIDNDRRELALQVWNTATRLHCNLDFQINSQPLAASLTAEPVIGGRAWPSFILHDDSWEPFVALWLNSTLGLINFWFLGSRQQSGRAILTLTRIGDLLVPDPRRFDATQQALAYSTSSAYAETSLLPANESWRDEARHHLDEIMLVDILGLDRQHLRSLDITREQWCLEPSVHGGQSSRPGH